MTTTLIKSDSPRLSKQDSQETNINYIHDYNDALTVSTEYFAGESLPASVFLDKYALRDADQNLLESIPHDMHHRIAREIYRIEQGKFKNPLSYNQIFEALEGFKRIIPQGSPMSGIGDRHRFVSLSNCFVAETPTDSYGGICYTDQQFVQICKRRGGIGTDLSELRPAGAPTQNSARTSTGIIPFARRYSNSIREVAQKGRRGASMLSLSIHHPEAVHVLPEGVEAQPITVKNKDMADIETTTECYDPNNPDFATIKYDLEQVTGANMSLRLTDEFMTAVDEDRDYQQRWPVEAVDNPAVSRMLPARRVWNKIIRAAWQMAEPGLLFWDNIIKESPADCYAAFGFKTVSTNPCSEIPLSVLDSCRLLVLNLYYYVKNRFTPNAYFDYDEFYRDAQLAQRLMDDIIDLELECIDRILSKIDSDPEPEHIKMVERRTWLMIREACANGRRTGTGITALGDTFAALGIKYGSPESIEVTDKIYRTLKLGAYRSSVDMAKELGPFPVWNHELEKDNAFLLRIKEESPELWEDMKDYGRRNIALLTSAPTGSVSILTQTTSGIEPLFKLYFIRRKKGNPGDNNFRVDFVDPSGDSWMHFKVYHSRVKEWMEVTGETDETKSPWFGCTAEDLDWTQRVRLQAAAQRHVDHAISSTINLPEKVSPDKVGEIYMEAWKAGLKGITVYREGSRSGVLVEDKKKTEKLLVDARITAQRPKVVECDIHHIKVKGQPYFVLVGTHEGEPFEVFAGRNSQPELHPSIKKGQVVREKKGYYVLKDGDSVILDNLTHHITDEQEALTRLASSTLRRGGGDVAFIVHQLEKTRGDMQGFTKAMARALKKYIPDGTKVQGEICPQCDSDSIIRQDGCVLCSNCGWTKC